MNIYVETTKQFHLILTEDEADILRALVQNVPVNAGYEVVSVMETLFKLLNKELD